MALRAVQAGVGAGQRKGGELVVVEPGGAPNIHVVAGFASGREIGSDVIQR